MHSQELFVDVRGRRLLALTRVLQDGNGIGDRGAEMIGEGLKVNSSLRELHLVRRFEIVSFLAFVLVFIHLCILISKRLLQSKQSSGPFNFVASSSLMRGCRNLRELSFDCCDWSACVASESWGELPVPPAAVIARGTEGVFEFVRAMLRGEVGVCVSGEFIATDVASIELRGRNLSFETVLPLLESFMEGKFLRLQRLHLVISSCDENDNRSLSLMSCRMEIGSGIEARR